MLKSRITQKGQATFPVEIRKHLGLKTGDSVAFEITEHGVMVRKFEPVDEAYVKGLERTLGEWATNEDEEAYRDL